MLVAIGAAVAVLTGIGAGLGIGLATGKAVDAIARQPEAESKISKSLLLGCALAEATAIYGFVIGLLIIYLNLVWTIINVIILYLLLKKFLIKPVTAIMDKREQMVKQGLESARAQESQAKELKVKYEEALASAKEESLQLVEKARGNAQVEYDRILGEADEQAKKIKEAAKKDVELDREKAMKEMQSEVAGLALTAVSRILQEGTDPQSDGALYEQFLKKAGEANDTDR